MTLRRRTIPALAAALAFPTAVLAAAPADAGSCKAPTGILRTNPDKTMNLPGGASVRIWDTGNLKANIKEVRIVAVRIPAGSLIPRAVTSSSLSKAATPQSQAKGNDRAVVVINGGVFDPSGASIPVRSQVIDGTVRKGTSGSDQGLALYEDTRTAQWTLHKTTGTVGSEHGSRDVGAVNWQTLAARGVSVYTRAWGPSAHPAGSRTVVVKGGRVTKVLKGNAGSRRPGGGESFLTARSRSDSDWVGSLRQGEAVTVRTEQSGYLGFLAKHPAIGTPDSVLGVSSALVRSGQNRAGCGSRDETLRPRSGLLWLPNGDLIVAAVAGRPNAAAGGATAHQWGEYMKQLGAVHAVNLDGGSSTTLLVRQRVGGPPDPPRPRRRLPAIGARRAHLPRALLGHWGETGPRIPTS
ncbi:phosphodiester glycosidase family protein [Sporichthya sp.]|uniref:phosphodiester glycosidase family protein n=1 Tax=Sporichthya sp. TaxID=65475 RepID=UPI00179CA615|nr:phosphodiester glycosidase family protein [Sporichthya sp.]MBA3742210.1 phosphodiester glycosidase family protein [Sporichthya sp.]